MFALIILAFIVYNFSLIKDVNIEISSSPEENYQNYCSGCHGEKLEKFIDRDWVYGNSWNEVFRSIKTGWPNDGMPSYDTTFTDQEISELVNFIMGAQEKMANEKSLTDSLFSGIIKSQDLSFHLDTVVIGLEIPWGIAFLPDGDLLVTDRVGILYRFGKDKKNHKISGVPIVKAKGQGGLLDIKLHPNFKKNGWLYLSYSKPKPSGDDSATTAVIRARLENDKLVEVKEIFEALPYLPTNHHYGSKLEFDNQGYLYISVGERGRENENPQNLENHCGKVHRVKDDGSIPADNPFIGNPKAIASIYSYGHRNIQGMVKHPVTGEIWTHEHGPRGGDEINIIHPAKNYGWPIISYGINYNGTKFTDITTKEGMEQPLLYWVPSIAPSGMDFVQNEKYKSWNGDLLVGSLKFKYINRCIMKDGKIVGQELLLKNIGRLREIKMGPDGYIYFTVETPGMVYRIVPEE